MKETYFTEQTLGAKAGEMLRSATDGQGGRRFAFSGQGSALLVLDMQRFFLDERSHAFIPSARAIVPGIKALVDAYTSRRLVVIFTRHLNTADNAGLMSRWWRDLIRQEDPFSEISGELDPSRGQVIVKHQYDAFYGTELETMLRQGGIKQVVICGVMANLCCETTARSAFMRGLEVFFCVDGTAAYNEHFHLATVRNLSFGFAVPVCVEQILTGLEAMDAG